MLSRRSSSLILCHFKESAQQMLRHSIRREMISLTGNFYALPRNARRESEQKRINDGQLRTLVHLFLFFMPLSSPRQLVFFLPSSFRFLSLDGFFAVCTLRCRHCVWAFGSFLFAHDSSSSPAARAAGWQAWRPPCLGFLFSQTAPPPSTTTATTTPPSLHRINCSAPAGVPSNSIPRGATNQISRRQLGDCQYTGYSERRKE